MTSHGLSYKSAQILWSSCIQLLGLILVIVMEGGSALENSSASWCPEEEGVHGNEG